MDSRRPGGRPSRPNTLGDAWRRASQPRQRQADHLPPLPDWPPMRGERLEDRAGAEWPSLGPSPSIGDAARDDRDYRDFRDDPRDGAEALTFYGCTSRMCLGIRLYLRKKITQDNHRRINAHLWHLRRLNDRKTCTRNRCMW